MEKRIRALNQEEFTAACPNGSVYGKYRGVFVYVELGKEEEYRERPNDDLKTNYRFFRNCKVEYSDTIDECQQGISQFIDRNVNVILMY